MVTEADRTKRQRQSTEIKTEGERQRDIETNTKRKRERYGAYLWCQVMRCATKCICFRISYDVLLAHTKVRYFDVSILVQQDIIRLQISTIHDESLRSSNRKSSDTLLCGNWTVTTEMRIFQRFSCSTWTDHSKQNHVWKYIFQCLKIKATWLD